VNTGGWQSSGSTVSGLPAGTYTVSFVALMGWTAPVNQNVNVVAGVTSTVTGGYTAVPTTGAITCTLTPLDAVNAGAQWRVDGGAWQSSGSTVSSLSVGTHTVSFVALSGWTAPANQSVNVVAGGTATVSGTYILTPTTGAINCTLTPADAVNAGAQWRVDSGAWQASGAAVSDLAPGSHTVSFVVLSGWTAPVNQTVNVVAGQTANISAIYQMGEDSTCGCTQSKHLNFHDGLRDLMGDWLIAGASLAVLFAISRAGRK
jgi:hypothetical protein